MLSDQAAVSLVSACSGDGLNLLASTFSNRSRNSSISASVLEFTICKCRDGAQLSGGKSWPLLRSKA